MSTTALDYGMVKRLILKDWFFLRWPILGYLGAGAFAVGMLALGGEVSFSAGSILLFTILISLGIHLPLATIIAERKDQTLPFVMSLPISYREYTTAKILGNLLIVLVPWTAITFGSLGVVAGRSGVPGGLIPFGAIVLTELLASSCLLFTVALVTDSLAWTVGVMVCANLFFQAFLYKVARLPGIAAELKSPTAVWNSTALTLLLGEVGLIALFIGSAFYFQSRKRDLL